MDDEIRTLVASSFAELERAAALAIVLSIGRGHVMAGSDFNLANARRAVLTLSEGRLDDLEHYAECAKRDFRDVIAWAATR